MKALILAAAATLFMAGAANAYDEMNMKKMDKASCDAAIVACGGGADGAVCKEKLKEQNGCDITVQR